MYCLGIIGVAAFTRLTCNPAVTLKDPLAVLCFLSAFALSRRFDASFHAAIPALVVVLALFLLKISGILFRKFDGCGITRNRALTLILILFVINIALPFGFHQILRHSKDTHWLESFSRLIPINPEVIIRLQGLAKFDMQSILFTFIEHFRTITGTYVWGHSFIPWSMSAAVALSWIGGWITLINDGVKPFGKISWLDLLPTIKFNTLLLILTGHLLIICSIMDPQIATESTHGGEFLALSQARLSAPGSIFIFLYPIMNFFAHISQRRGYIVVENLVAAYAFALLIKVYPILFIIEAY
jgi:hypothetical protein